MKLPMPKKATGVVPVSMPLTASPPPLNGTRDDIGAGLLVEALDERDLRQWTAPI